MDRLLKAVYLSGVIAEIVIRLPHERQRRQTTMTDERVTAQERWVLAVLFLGMFFLPVCYSFTPWLDRADYRWSAQARARAGGAGTAILACALWLFWRAHEDLGRNWSPTLQVAEEHALVTDGVYRSIRHPMYASQWLWCVAQSLLLQNWIVGPTSFLFFLPLYLLRVPREEQMMIDHFGDAYRAYMERTGRVVPRIG
ncbi:MAG TPA: protein-S-isoprenylcysteine O-methyltransferase [Herpetosiphonaceae bacterium]